MTLSRYIIASLALLPVAYAAVHGYLTTIYMRRQLREFGDTLSVLESRQYQTDQYLQATLSRLADGTPTNKQCTDFGVDRDRLARYMASCRPILPLPDRMKNVPNSLLLRLFQSFPIGKLVLLACVFILVWALGKSRGRWV